MDSNNNALDITKKYKVGFDDDEEEETLIIEFTEENEVYPEEMYSGYTTKECYILDENGEADTRAVCYIDQYGDIFYLRYSRFEDEKVKMRVISCTVQA